MFLLLYKLAYRDIVHNVAEVVLKTSVWSILKQDFNYSLYLLFCS
jgi:hypothetical protein